jgi:hypothetical protein
VLSARTVIRLKNFVSRYQGLYRRRTTKSKNPQPERIKVAIIDTGVDESEFGSQEITDFVGETFSETGDSHWWLSADSHGTQMARLVLAIDPCCQLYVAKVGDFKTDIAVGAVTNVSHPTVISTLGIRPRTHLTSRLYYGPSRQVWTSSL